ncbi:MAG: FeoA family protein [Vicinamibacterales bacterium]
MVTSPAAAPILLSDLAVGAVARLHEAQLDAEGCHQLRSLGLTGSCKLTLCKKGEPCIVQVRSTRIGISRAVARHIFVVPLTVGPG